MRRGTCRLTCGTSFLRYLDFLSAYSAVNQGHAHPKILAALSGQAAKLTLTSRAFHNSVMGVYARFVTDYFGFDRVLPMNTGVEAVETAVKLSRRWGYDIKGIPENEATVLFAENNFWGRSLAACSSSSDSSCRNGFGPFMSHFDLVPYGDLDALKAALQANPHICAFVFVLYFWGHWAGRAGGRFDPSLGNPSGRLRQQPT